MTDLSDLRQLARSMSESELQANVIQLAQALGYLVHAERPARTSKGYRTPIQGDAGFFDLVLMSPTRFIVAELKSERGQTTTEQEAWAGMVQDSFIDYYLWRPSHWLDGTIERTLRGEE